MSPSLAGRQGSQWSPVSRDTCANRQTRLMLSYVARVAAAGGREQAAFAEATAGRATALHRGRPLPRRRELSGRTLPHRPARRVRASGKWDWRPHPMRTPYARAERTRWLSARRAELKLTVAHSCGLGYGAEKSFLPSVSVNTSSGFSPDTLRLPNSSVIPSPTRLTPWGSNTTSPAPAIKEVPPLPASASM